MGQKLNNITIYPLLLFVIIALLAGCSTQNPTEPSGKDVIVNRAPIGGSNNIGGGETTTSPPREGTVYEGVSVPGAALGETRAEIEDGYGVPYYVSGPGYSQYSVEGGGAVGVTYVSADGGSAEGSQNDVARRIRWTESVSGWVTTAGVNTILAEEDPEATVAAYPDAEVTYYETIFAGQIYSLIAYEQGIAIYRPWIHYTSGIHTQMEIFYPTTPPPDPEPVKMTRVEKIELYQSKTKSLRKVYALVHVQNDKQIAVEGALVKAKWALPDGSFTNVEAITSNTGYAYFEINNAKRGDYVIIIDDVILEDHIFDKYSSKQYGRITVK